MTEQNKKWAELLREARLKLQADLDSVEAALDRSDYVDIQNLAHSILSKNEKYIEAASSFERWLDREEDEDSSFIFRVFSQWMAGRSEKQMAMLGKKIISDAHEEFEDARRHNTDYLETSLKHTELSSHIAQIKHYESKLSAGVFSEKDFATIWDNRFHARLNVWQETVIRPQFDPKFNKKSQIDPRLESPSLHDIAWLSDSTKVLYGMPQSDVEEIMKAKP